MSVPTANPTAAPVANISIGSCSSFAVLGGGAIVFNSALTIIKTGSIGNSPSVTGNYRLNDGTVQGADTSSAQQCAADLDIAYAEAAGTTCTKSLADAYLSGTMLTGIYCHGTLEIPPSTVLTLDAENNSRVVWVFQASTTLITGMHSSIVLKNGAQASNVFWTVGSSATIGYASTFVGQILAKVSVVANSFSLIGGRILVGAAVTFQSGSSIDIDYVTAVTGNVSVSFGSCENIAVLAGTTLTFGSGQTVLATGSVGVSSDTTISGNYSLTSGSAYANTAEAISCAYDFAEAFNTVSTATCGYYLSSSDLSDLTLTSGVYCSVYGILSIGQLKYVTLDAVNVPGAVWVFQTTTTLTTASGSSIIFKNGALSVNVYWAIGTSVNIGYDSFFAGNILSYSSVTIASYAELDGRALSMTAVTFAGYSTASLPNGTSVVVYPANHIYLGSCEEFAILAGGASTFTLATTIFKGGSLGGTGSAVTGNYRLDSGTLQISTTSANQCATDFVVAKDAASGATCTNTLTIADLSGLTLTPGVYCFGTMGIAASGILKLDAENNVDALWIFQTTTTVITSTKSSIVLINGAQVRNVWWSVGTSATIGKSSIFVGNILATAAVIFAAKSVLQGRGLALAAITVSDGSWIDTSFSFVSGTTSVGSCVTFNALAGVTISFISLATTFSLGSIGVSPGTSITGTYVLKDGNAYSNTEEAIDCMTDFTTAYNSASVATCEYYLSLGELSGLTLSPGVYCSAPGTFAIAVSGLLRLDAQNISSSQWIFQADTTLTTGVDSVVEFINGGMANNVYWVAGTSVTTGVRSKGIGSVLALTSITWGYQSKLEGRGLAMTSITFSGNVTTILPPISPTGQPSSQPSRQPSSQPTSNPTSPSGQPSTQPTSQPTNDPTSPSGQPSTQPSSQPTSDPTSPSGQPSTQPSSQPTSNPPSPSGQPSTQPSSQPTSNPPSPSGQPSTQPTSQPSMQPSAQPTKNPAHPSIQLSSQPSSQPSGQPSNQPTCQLSTQPSARPSSSEPSSQPSSQPSMQPSRQPLAQPSSEPSGQPSNQPTNQPSTQPSAQPSTQPSSEPSDQPINQPTSQPSTQPSARPSSSEPSSQPSMQLSSQPSSQPSVQPSSQPSTQPTSQPSNHPSTQPSYQPSRQPR
jgi:hypothetical protein